MPGTAREVVIDPITRLEGHGKIDILLDENGEVKQAYFQVPELRGFEKFAVGRPAEAMPQITSRICGVCPTAHHMASTKCLDDLFQVEPTPVAKKIRELVYSAFYAEDHALHFYFLGGPDFVVGPQAPPAERNVLGVIGKVGVEVGKQVIAIRKQLRSIITTLGGKVIHPVLGLPGGVSRAVKPDEQQTFKEIAAAAVEFGKFTLKVFDDVVLSNKEYVDLITSDTFTHRTYYMGLVDENNRLNFYDGDLRVVSPTGEEYAKFRGLDYLKYVGEHVEPWSYIRFSYLRPMGWRGFVDGPESSVFCVAPLARLNAADGITTPIAQEAFEKFFTTLGPGPVHHTLANHWARVIELMFAVERLQELANDPDLCDPNIRNIPTETPSEGVGIVEAPRGTLIHHYRTDEKGIITSANLIVATQGNAARIAMSVDKAAKGLIHKGEISDGILNMIEMAFRAYDPCHGCACHTLPGTMPLIVRVFDACLNQVALLRRDMDGSIVRQ